MKKKLFKYILIVAVIGGVVAVAFFLFNKVLLKKASAPAISTLNGVAYVSSEKLFFRATDKTIEKTIILDRVLLPEVYKGQLFFISDTGLSIFLQPEFSKHITINGVTQETVKDYFIHEDRVFFILGSPEQCFNIDCPRELYVYDLNSKKEKMLSKDIKANHIIGYNDLDEKLYFEYKTGAEAYWKRTVGAYSINTEKLVALGIYGGCQADLSVCTEREAARYQKDVRGSVKSYETRWSLNFLEGKIVMPSQEDIVEETWSEIRYIQ